MSFINFVRSMFIVFLCFFSALNITKYEYKRIWIGYAISYSLLILIAYFLFKGLLF